MCRKCVCPVGVGRSDETLYTGRKETWLLSFSILQMAKQKRKQQRQKIVRKCSEFWILPSGGLWPVHGKPGSLPCLTHARPMHHTPACVCVYACMRVYKTCLTSQSKPCVYLTFPLAEDEGLVINIIVKIIIIIIIIIINIMRCIQPCWGVLVSRGLCSPLSWPGLQHPAHLLQLTPIRPQGNTFTSTQANQIQTPCKRLHTKIYFMLRCGLALFFCLLISCCITMCMQFGFPQVSNSIQCS